MTESPVTSSSSLVAFAREKLADSAERGLLRRLIPTRRGGDQTATRQQRSFVSFSDNDYLGLSQDRRLCRAAARAALAYGAGAGASRLVTGDHPLMAELEHRLAALKGHEAAVVFGSGYLANIGTIPVLAGRNDLILADRLVHACLHAGAQLSGAQLLRFRHNDMEHLDELLRRHRAGHRRALILTDAVFSMDGDQAPLGEIARLAARYDAWVLADDAHGVGVLGDGRGTAAAQGVALELGMGTLSKALGSYGGYVTGPAPVMELIRNRARSLIFTTGLPPAAAGAALRAVEIVDSEPALCRRPLTLARRFCAAAGLPEPHSAVVPIVTGAPQAALAAQAKLEERGFLVVAIRPPSVPHGTARLRLSFSAAHREADVDRLADAVRDLGLAGA